MVIGEHTSQHPDELYTARRNIIKFFEYNHPEQFDFYGRYWTSQNHPCYKGVIKHKLPYISQYKFAICYENMRSQTYITEKIFDILHAGCVPVYWGAKEITKYIPYRCYILRENFASDDTLVLLFIV
jgi:alpha(1,3/1,4) fucosyltransferase